MKPAWAQHHNQCPHQLAVGRLLSIYRKGKKPQKPGLNASSNAGNAETMNESQNGTNRAWKQRVNMDGVELEPWQKALLNPQKKKK